MALRDADEGTKPDEQAVVETKEDGANGSDCGRAEWHRVQPEIDLGCFEFDEVVADVRSY